MRAAVARMAPGPRVTVALALAGATLLAVWDAAFGPLAVLIDFQVVFPLLAATRAGRRGVGAVALYCLALAVPLGLPNDVFGEEPHLLAIAIVATGGALAVLVAHLRAAGEEAASRLAAQHAVARTLAESRTLDEAAPPILGTLGSTFGWSFGAIWTVGPPGVLRCVDCWCAPGATAGGFAEVTRALTFEPGVGLPGRVWVSGEPAWISDLAEDANFPRADAASAAALRSAAAFPLRTGGRVLGVIELFASDLREPDRQLLDFMAAFGAQIGEFLERRRAEEVLRASEALKTAMFEAAHDCVITMDHRGRVVELNPAAEATFGYRREDAIGQEMAGLIIPPALRDRHREAVARCVETGEARLLDQRLELTGMHADGHEFPVELTITRIRDADPPVFTGYVRDITERKRGEEERTRLLRLEHKARVDAARARDQLEAILQGVADGVTAQAADGRLVFANDAAVETLGYDSAEALLEAPLEDVMQRFEVLDEEGHPFPLERLPGRQALAGKEPSDEVVRFRARSTGEERWSVVKATPIRDEEGDVVMAINVFEDITAHKRSERGQRFLADASRVLSTSLDYETTLRQIAELAVPDIADWCVIDMQQEDGSLERVTAAHADPVQLQRLDEMQERYPPDPRAPLGVPQVLRTGEPQLYERIPEETLRAAARDERHLDMLKGFGLRSAMIVPMVARGRAIGTITFASGPSGRRFDRGSVALAEELGRRAGNAVENARLYGERSYIARTLQQSLLPPGLPRIHGIDVAARFRPAGEGNEVGGDFYDLFQTGRCWTTVIGDVCGKGADAAAVTALARYTLRAAALQEPRPSDTLRLLNDALLRQRADRRFCTVAYGLLKPGDSGVELEVSSGGHPLPLILRRSGAVESVGVHGTLLGVVDDPDLHDRRAQLDAGDSLVFYTDGVIEARGPHGQFDDEDLEALLAASAGLDAGALAGRIEAAALAAQDGRARDDIAVLVLRAAPTSARPAGNGRGGALAT